MLESPCGNNIRKFHVALLTYLDVYITTNVCPLCDGRACGKWEVKTNLKMQDFE